MLRRELPATALAVASAGGLALLIFAGSRDLADFDSALIGYAVATLFAVAALAYRYTLWITRPPTWRYFRAGWLNFLSWRNFRRYTTLIPLALFHDIFAQTFILKRGVQRWLMHMSIFWGVIVSCLVTFPLTFGWIRFTLIPPDNYQLWFFGLPMMQFPILAGTGFALFHALDFSAILLIAGVAIALWRRINDGGLLSTQRLDFDLAPLVLLFAIAVTGLALSASSLFWEGRFYWFISLTHQVTVVGWLLSLPFGKFFHIIERPASIGVSLYQTLSHDAERSAGPAPATTRCRRCGEELPSTQFIADLKATLSELHQNYDLGGERGWLQEYCPSCKRILRGQAYYQAAGNKFL